MRNILFAIFIVLLPVTASAYSYYASLASASSQAFSAVDSASLHPTAAFSVAGWFYMNNPATFGGLTAKASTVTGNGANGYGIDVSDITASRVSCFMENSTGSESGGSNYVTMTTNAPTKTWTFVWCTWDGTTLKIGEDSATINATKVTGIVQGSNALEYDIGKWLLGTTVEGVTLDGGAFFVRVWGTNLDPNFLYNSRCQVFPSAYTNLNAQWQLDNNLLDGSGNTNTLTNLNSTPFTAGGPCSNFPIWYAF